MSRLVIGNRSSGAQAHRMVWFAREGDVVVLPSYPTGEFLDLLRRLAALPAGEPRIAVPPAGRQGAESLDDGRLAVPGFVGELRKLAGGRGVDRLLAVRHDAAVLRLAREAGLDGPRGVPAFLAQHGGGLVGDLAVFRALASGNAVPVPEGRVCTGPREAEEFVWPLLAGGRAALVRPARPALPAGAADELIVPVGGPPGADADTTIAVADRETLGEYLAKSWERYSRDGAFPVVVEHYTYDGERLRIEFLVEAGAVTVLYHGRLRTTPIRNGLVIPPPPTADAAKAPDLGAFVAHATRVMEVVRALGYRGYAGLDAVVGPDGDVLFRTLHGGVTDTTHLAVVARYAIGEDCPPARVLISRDRVPWPSFATAQALLDRSGLAFDPDTRTGVLLTGDDLSGSAGPADGPGGGSPVPSGQFLAVGRDHAHAGELEAGALAALDRTSSSAV
ncbi:peptide ligase PGM1-related protein [Catenulispora subtropica]